MKTPKLDLNRAELVAKLRCQNITYKAIANQINVSTERARQIESQYINYMINIKRSCNKWNNFRKANLSQNQGNSNLRIDNKTGMKGVYYRKRDGVYVAQITINGKRKHIGQSKDALIAYQMYLDAAELHFGEFSNA